MKRIIFLLVSFLPICVYYLVLRISSIVSFIVDAYIGKYTGEGNFSLSNIDISKIISESFGKTNATGLVVGSLITILIFFTWIIRIRKKADSKSRFKFEFKLSILAVAFVYAVACQAILYLAIGSSFSDQGIIMIALLLFAGAIGEQLLCRAITMHYSRMASGNFWVANAIQAFIIASIQSSLLRGACAFALGFLMGVLFDKARKGGLQDYSIDA